MSEEKISINDIMLQSHLQYSLSVIIDRALPDVRDGLKPSQRRIIYSMYELNLSPTSNFRKCAKICGDTSGNYHPHGQGVVYPTLISMGQQWNMLCPLVEGQGNVGSIDGDSPAQMRYVQARLSNYAMDMLMDIQKQTVQFRDNYDVTRKQPQTLPSMFPNLMVNGCFGIAVGRSTSMPPHNLGQVCDAIIKYMDKDYLSEKDLCNIIKSPDFPTGGFIYGMDGVKEYLTTGKGKFYIRGKMVVQQHIDKRLIVITQIPYGVNKSSIVDKLLKSVKEGKIQDVIDMYDESSQQGIRLCIRIKKTSDQYCIIQQIYDNSNMQISYNANCQVLVNNKPILISYPQLIRHYVEYRKTIIRKRSQYLLKKYNHRMMVLKSYNVALKNSEPILKIIQKNSQEFIYTKLMDDYNLSQQQCKIILEMKLNKFTKMQVQKLVEQARQLKSNIDFLSSVIQSDQNIKKQIKKQLKSMKKKYNNNRKTTII